MTPFLRVCCAAVCLAYTLPAADLTGIWMGEIPGPNGTRADLALQFQTSKGVTSGIVFGDEFDLPVRDLKLDGNKVTFTVASPGFNNRPPVKTVYTGILSETTLELRREPLNPEPSAKPKEPAPKLILKKIA